MRTILVAFLVLTATPQVVNAISVGKFKKALKKGREFGKPYSFEKDYVWDRDRQQIYDVADKNGFRVLDIVNIDKFSHSGPR